jgi:C1A family cysteine protease
MNRLWSNRRHSQGFLSRISLEKKFSRHFYSQLILPLLGYLIFIPSLLYAQLTAEPTPAPVNPAFIDALRNLESMNVQTLGGGERGFGLIPSPIDLSHLKGQQILQGFQLLGYSPTYDLRFHGKLTPVRNQGGCGSCWSFATFGSLESNLLPLETWDFSENNLINTHGFDRGPCDGGNADMATAYLARWDGPVSEADDPYTFTSPPDLMERKHLQEVLIIPDRIGPLDNDNIKQAVMTYGSLYTSMYWGDAYYQTGNHAYYFSGANGSNHAVAIIGWDDNYDKNRFSTVPPDNGAFIIRNSWGTWFGESGYFYMSYYDSSVGKGNYVFHTAQPTSNYSHIYQYDPLGWVNHLGYGNNTGWFANVFTAISNEPLTAVSFYTASLNSAYEVHVYDHVTSGPTSGSLGGSKTGTLSLPGYHTILLDSPVSLTSGDRFSVIVQLTTPGFTYPIPIERPYAGYSGQATANSGESYISSNGNSWSDLTSVAWCPECNVCLKAFSAGTGISHQIITDLVTDYYMNILDRPPEAGGAEGWTSEIERLINLGVDVKEGFIALGKTFFNSPEYLSKGKTNAAYVIDLYETFLQRTPSQGEVDLWMGFIAGGSSRNIVLSYFAFSPEFKAYMEGIFGMSPSRPENNLINDFYRGILIRLPDTAGFDYWLDLMRAAQCAGSQQQIRDLCSQVASLFVNSEEYAGRGRTNTGYVEDLYDAILRRSADPSEVNYWVEVLNAGTMTRDQVLQFFTASNEFQTRVQIVIGTGCLP